MITSRNNEMFKYFKKLKQNKYIKENQEFLVYGEKLIFEAYKAGIVKTLISSDESNQEALIISKDLMKELNIGQTNFDLIALCSIKEKPMRETKNILVLEDVQDPDNVGALLRSALAFGFNHVILSKKSANIFNEKVIRASAGASFHLSYEILDNIYDRIKTLKKLGYQVYVTDTNGKSDLENVANKSILVLSNEGNGLSLQMKQLANEIITIKTNEVESLNVAVAGAILMYEWSKK
ncbi:MAG TPA: RNA methyltransferase [Acholeplasmataceae bacterium]|nr:RNA methyltransferase [Acholeplasmataceae bacterium]